MSNNYRFETLQQHAGQTVDPTTLSRAVPLYQTTSYLFKNAEHGANLFALKEFGNIYTRLQNPTTDVFENRVAALEGGLAALATASGHSAQLVALTALLNQGDNFVSSPYLYGGSYNQFTVTFKNWGIECRIAASDKAADLEKQINEKTKAIYVETIGNPSFSIPDFELISALARKYDLPLIVDNTFGACGYLCAPIKYGASVVVESATKWIGGHGTSMGGVIVEGGNYNWGNGKFPQLSEPSEGYHGLNFFESFGQLSYIIKCRTEGLRDLGPAISPFNSFQMIIGLETLSLRVEREAQNALALAHYFESHPKVEKVFYPGLKSDENHKNGSKYLQHGYGCVLSVVLKGSKSDTEKFVDNLHLVSHLANVGDTKTLIIQPSATIHSQLSAEAQIASAVLPTMLRISAGIEHIDDIINDFETSFKQLQ
ncbi:MAG: aminotransferase class I/II-fold pyridoxal phosphate-dependent enzyme [Rikenellaceae bacterium]